MARPGRFSERPRELINHRLHLEHHAGLSSQSRALLRQLSSGSFNGLCRLHLHVSFVGRKRKKGRDRTAVEVNSSGAWFQMSILQITVANFVRAAEDPTR